MKKIILGLAILLVSCGTSYSREPYVPQPIPSELFTPVIVDPIPEKTISPRPRPSIIQPTPIAIIKQTPKPKTSNQISGIASWYCKTGVSRCTIGHSGGYYAAIRRDLLELRGERVLVCSSGGCVRVTIIDCNCGPNANLIDLYWDAFNAIGNPSAGVMKVTLKW